MGLVSLLSGIVSFMITKLKSKFKSEDNKRLLSNFLSLVILQGASYILPLITLPYLVRVLGVENYGLLAFATAMIAYFSIMTDYGFNLTATREISIHRNNKAKLIEIFSSVMIIKLIFMIISFIAMSIIVLSFEKFSQNWEIYFLTFGTVVGQVLFPIWFFQGMERMKYITYLNIGSRLLFTIAIFVFIHNQTDLYIVPLLNAISGLTIGIISLIILKIEFGIKFKFQERLVLKEKIIEGWHIFVSSIGIQGYKINSILILGIFTSELIVGYFVVAKKILDITNQLNGIISRVYFPYLVSKATLTKASIKKYLNPLLFVMIGINFIVFILLFVFSSEITYFITKKQSFEIVYLIKLFSILPLIIGINVPAVHYLLLSKKDKLFSLAVIIGFFVDIILNFILIPNFSYQGAGFSVFITEILVTILLYTFAYKEFKRCQI